MASVPQTQPARKVFRATVYDQAGVLAKVDGQITFFHDADSAIIDFEPKMAPWTCILGEVGISETQALMDRLHGGAAQIACARLQEVA
jgi:hypothetical protein